MKKDKYKLYKLDESFQWFMVGDYVIAKDSSNDFYEGRLILVDNEFAINSLDDDYSFRPLRIFPMAIDDYFKYKSKDECCYLRSMVLYNGGIYSARLYKTLSCVDNEYLLTICINGFKVCEAYVHNTPMLQHILNTYNLSINQMRII